MSHSYCVYVLSSKSGVLYIGSANDLDRRVFKHKQGLIEGFSKKYKVTRLVYVEDLMDRRRWLRASANLKDEPEEGSSSKFMSKVPKWPITARGGPREILRSGSLRSG